METLEPKFNLYNIINLLENDRLVRTKIRRTMGLAQKKGLNIGKS